MVSLPVRDASGSRDDSGCGGECGAGLEKVYPTMAVRFGAMRWVGEFTFRRGSVFRCGAKVVIQTDRGLELGEQVSLSCTGCTNSVSREQIKRYVENSGPEFYGLRAGRILREASADDLRDHEHLNAGVRADIDKAQLLAAQLDLPMKIVTVEHLLGGERIVFYFRSDERIDFRDLVRQLAADYRTRIELRQVGARDEARLVADYEICGRECCCKNFLKKLRPVTMKMAKLQKSTLDPTKVSGRCGRLRCCLRYEHVGYEELLKRLPRPGAWADTEYGPAEVLDRQVLTQLVLVRVRDGRELTIPIEELRAFPIEPPVDGGAGPAPVARRFPAGRNPHRLPVPREESVPDRPEDEVAGELDDHAESEEAPGDVAGVEPAPQRPGDAPAVDAPRSEELARPGRRRRRGCRRGRRGAGGPQRGGGAPPSE